MSRPEKWFHSEGTSLLESDSQLGSLPPRIWPRHLVVGSKTRFTSSAPAFRIFRSITHQIAHGACASISKRVRYTNSIFLHYSSATRCVCLIIRCWKSHRFTHVDSWRPIAKFLGVSRWGWSQTRCVFFSSSIVYYILKFKFKGNLAYLLGDCLKGALRRYILGLV